MSNLVNDTRQKQILREEVWYGSYSMQVNDYLNPIMIGILTDVNEVQFNMESISSIDLKINLLTGVSFAAGPVNAQTNYNMRLSSAATTSVVITAERLLNAGGVILDYIHPQGINLDITPFKEDSGIILDASTQYAIAFYNTAQGDESANVNINWFFREI